MISYEKAAELVREDFEQFYDAELVQPYFKEKHIRMACNIIINMRYAGSDASPKMLQMVQDTAHGLNHIFFQGFNAGDYYREHAES